MADITGSLTTLTPDDGKTFGTGTNVTVSDQGTFIVPAAGATARTYKISTAVDVVNYKSCKKLPLSPNVVAKTVTEGANQQSVLGGTASLSRER